MECVLSSVRAAVQAMRKFFGSDKLGFTLSVPAGSARIEPGLPAEDVTVSFPTWTFFEKVRLPALASCLRKLHPREFVAWFVYPVALLSANKYVVHPGLVPAHRFRCQPHCGLIARD